jgi:hypothetical protein
MRPEGSWPSAFKRLIRLQRGVTGARAISFAAIPFSRSSSHLWCRHLNGRRRLALSPEGEGNLRRQISDPGDLGETASARGGADTGEAWMRIRRRLRAELREEVYFLRLQRDLFA